MKLRNIKKKLPWWVKIVSKLLLSRIRFIGYSFWKSIGVFEHGRMNNPEYAAKIFNDHYKLVNKPKKGFVCMEMGNGDSLSTAINATVHGAKKIYLVDVGFFANTDINIYHELMEYLNSQGYVINNKFSDYREMLNKCNTEYLTDGIKSYRNIPDNSIDFVFSQAVLEHIYQNEFEDTMMQIFRILKRGGQCSHVIDLKDHLDYSINNLRFKEKIWESKIFRTSGFYTNRLRKHEMIKIFGRIGFKVQIVDEKKWDNVPVAKNKLAKPYRNMKDEELLTSYFTVILSK
ncbi:MAG: methyltransferase domain-containing protein [Bacillota bacterium]